MISGLGAGVARPVERLEERRLLSASVTATQLNPPLTAGTTWTYQYGGGLSGTDVETVIGPATFNGNSATEVDEQKTFVDPRHTSTTLVQNYETFASQGLIEYGTVTTAQSTAPVTQIITPALIEFPATLSVGSPVTHTYSYSTGSPSSETVTLTLVSGTPQQVTVPAGTYSAYEMDNTVAGTSVTIQSWFAANVGLIKQIINTGTTTTTQELSAFSGSGGGGGGGGGSGSGTVTPALKTALPASVVGTTPLAIHNSVNLTAGSTVRGKVSAALVLSPDTSASDAVFTLASGHTSLSLASGKSHAIPLTFARSIPSSVGPGTYNVLLTATDPTGATQTTTAQQLTVVAPVVDLTGSFATAPATAKAGRKMPFAFTITNSSAANVAAVGSVQIEFESSPDGLLADASPLESITKRVNLKPGKSQRLSVSLALSATSFVVVDVDPGNTAFPNDVNIANNVFTTTQAVVVS